MLTPPRPPIVAVALAASLALGACGGGDSVEVSVKPSFVGTVKTTTYDGVTDDLLTAGLGRSGLASAVAPTLSAVPTAAELRRLAIHSSYRGLVDTTTNGGYGVFYGPNVDAAGVVGSGEGRIAGTETITFSDDGSGQRNVTLMVQVPAGFDPAQPCIVTATSSGSRGVYGAISTGEWGLKRGCAVAYTDKGTGSAPHDLAADTVPLIDGTRSASATAGAQAAFRAALSATDLTAFNAATPNRFAFKHAHSQRNPEKDWGNFTLQAVEFAFWVLNERYGQTLVTGAHERRIRPENTIVIASSVSNGGGAAIAAAEIDRAGLIDGVAVAEPAIEMPPNPGVTVRRGITAQPTIGKTLVDFTTYANLYQSCAALSPQVAGTPGAAFVVTAFATNRCASLKAKGLLTASTTTAQADEALQKLRDYGWEPEAAVLHASHAAFEIASAVSVTFANALSRASVKDHLCGYSFGATTPQGVPTALATAAVLPLFATGNGVPPSAGVQLINNLSPGAPLRDLFSFSPSTLVQDFNLDGALCLRDLIGGTGPTARALQAGVDETRRSGRLGGKPALIVHGRDDALLPVNHTSRPYTAMSKTVEGANSKLSYIEVANAQHFDGFIGLPAVLPGYDTRYVPLHLYLFRALDAMYAHLKNGTALPPSQVVRTLPRGGTPGSAPALTAANVPAISAAPQNADAITMSGTTLSVPD
ncbi:D-(-)-3-hydroxybutyrate oligomer hydrolase [Ideonella sp. A 288]|uniref:D-(-)-3-hydroxybutyrate oligomer hydrolase n=1 Tax=Ideonella sp. A 288 TaxID=1962181 RepID=UPI000B4C0261|nr:D-(-)-3-hydroxybutyrate oligomer hydrolase [Ideonella sp. A 288]